jgi:hypothetical protein
VRRVIYKYRHAITDRQVVEMPAGSEIITVGFQRGKLCMWAKAYRGSAEVRRQVISIVGTGHLYDVADAGHYIGTAISDTLVWHVFASEAW